ncbi:MAG: hypothetical protein JWM86_1252 [Thermoleophilia bacterium]|nr:hypothetical protein [Thermoleophilia bacterium]
MNRVRSLATRTGRPIPLLLALAGAILLAFALTYEQPRSAVGPSSEGSSGGGVGGDAQPALVDPATSGPTPSDTSVVAKSATARSESLVAPETEEIARDAVGAATPGAGGTDVSIDPVGSLGAPSIDAKIVRTASIELRVTKRGRFEDVWGDAQAVAGAHGGYVVASSRSGAGKGPRVASITMSVPSRRFDTAVSRLRDIGGVSVRRLDVASQDVTQEFVDVRSRLKHDRAVEGRLLALLAQTQGVSEVLAVQSRLDTVQEQIELSRGRLDYLGKMTSMSTVELTISERGARTSDTDEDEDSVLGAAWGDARDRLAENVAGTIVWFGGALPALVLLAVIALVGRTVHRRRTARVASPD